VLQLIRQYTLGPVLLAGLASLLVWAVAVLCREDLGGAGMTVLFTAGSSHFGGSLPVPLAAPGEKDEVARLRAVLSEEREMLDALRKSVDEDVRGFEKRRHAFENRLMTYHEWMEFPNLDAWSEVKRAPQELDDRDKMMIGKVQESADRILEGFRTDRFSDNGKFEPRLLLNEMAGLVADVARIYQPLAKEPLLETSLESFLRRPITFPCNCSSSWSRFLST